ncbi:hypothetical protein BH11MYX3_BH11MYX3_42050 [soil metagenome]
MTERDDDELADLRAIELVPPPLAPGLDRELGQLAPVAMRRPRRQLATVITIAGIVIIALLATLGVRADVHELPPGWMPVVAAGWLVGLVFTAWFALVPRRGSVMPRWRIAALFAAMTSCLYVVLGLLVHPAGRSSLIYGSEHFVSGRGCLVLGLATATTPVVFGAWFLRGTAPVRTRWVAAALGAAGGCGGGLLLHFYCRIADGLHIGLIHGGVVGCAALIAALVVPRAITPRS